ncbi:65-kDa microtubule-associated protein 8 [Macadamia integrifolia]|uniref:65-kDa microtubule-associated protein 8 n=1 Tax=Macadamia integrifolia TaxID=60698 RepID=UPI001C4ECF10|nr:65-kDa microtubule-associated protein 8 [Macadamia integrifolia]
MGSFQMPANMRSSSLLETSCGYLLQELQLIWDEVGQHEYEREKALMELEQECLDVYRRKVDSANISRARLHQALADAEAEFTHLLVSLDERSLPVRPEKMVGTLKEQLDSITPALREMQQRKEDRVKQFQEVQIQIQKISAEIAGQAEKNISLSDVIVNENDLSLKKLEEYQMELQQLHNEKRDRLLKMEAYISSIHKLSATLGMDSSRIITEVHPSLDTSCGQQSKNISDAILARLNSTVTSLKEEKEKRLEKLHKLGKALTNLWSLMDTSYSDRRLFSHVTNFITVSAAEISSPGSLTLDIIQQAEAEVARLDQLKASKMKELFLKKQIELEEICKRTHMEIPSQSEMDNILNLLNSGEIDHADLLTSMDEQISRAKEEATSRKAIMEKVDKWMLACDEERWLEEYSRDENRYTVSRGAHKNLKRAEHARITVSKIPALVHLLMAKTKSWEEERKKVFLYDEVPLLAMLEEYTMVRKEREEEKIRQRETKRMQMQAKVVVEQENLFLSRPSTSNRRLSNRSINGGLGGATPLNWRLSMGIQQLGSNSINSTIQGMCIVKEVKKAQVQKILTQQGRASHLIEDTASMVSASHSDLFSP